MKLHLKTPILQKSLQPVFPFLLVNRTIGHISTVMLPNGIFETCVFLHKDSEVVDRYKNLEDAVIGHDIVRQATIMNGHLLGKTTMV